MAMLPPTLGPKYVTVNVLRARDLAIADANGLSDPYVILNLGRQKKKTSVIKKTLNPEWNESFVLEKVSDYLIVDVWDWDRGSSDDFLGHVVVDLNPSAFGEERWYKLGQRAKEAKENVSGEILISFIQGGDPNARKPRASNVIEEIKARILEAQKAEGKTVDFSACELNRIPKSVMEAFSNVMQFNLSFNKFLAFPELDLFTMLEDLDLTGNQITSLPLTITSLTRLKELHLNGNKLTTLPDQIGTLTALEKLYVSNNQISKITLKIAKLRRLEELTLTGNPLVEVPPSIGLCCNMEVLDLSCCGLTYIPGELTYMTRLMELNLATNELKELPQAMGRMTRLVMLNISDNKLTDLPVSLGSCYGLAKLGAGILVERNPLTDQEMIRKYRIGTDHLHDYLEKKLITTTGFKLEEYDVGRFDDTPKPVPTKAIAPPEIKKPAAPPQDNKLDEKLNVLKRWANTTIQQELRVKISSTQQKATELTDLEAVMQIANFIKTLKPEMEKARPLLPAFEAPKAQLNVMAPKIDQLKAIITAALSELAMTLKGVQDVMNNTNSSKEVVSMVAIVKQVKAIFDGQK